MRLASLFCSLILLTGISTAQDTSFSSGPQYLMTSGSPMFLQPIATPSLSLSAPLSSPSAPAEAVPEPASPFAGTSPHPDLTRIFWGEPMSERVNPNATESASEIELTSAVPAQPLPASIVDTGVTGMTNAQTLHRWGYGVPLGETAAFWKTHKPHAPRVYTNADVKRLRAS